MFYFVHPQIKFNIKNLLNLFFCFLKNPGQQNLQKIERMFPGKQIYFTDMGRGAFRLIIEKFNLQNSQMLVPAFICDIFYPIFKQYNITPIFLDIEKQTFNINPDEIARKITSQTKAILICHVYGLPVNVKKIKETLNLSPITYHLSPIIIEDCAHSFGGKLDEKFLGNFGEATFFSLYKLFPTLRGGIAIINQKLAPHRNEVSGAGSKIPGGEPSVPYGTGKNQKCLFKTRFGLRDFISLLNCFPFFSFLFKKYAGEIAPKYIRKEKLEKPSQLNRVSLNIFSWQFKNLERILEKRKALALFFQQELKKMGFEVQESANNSFTFLSALVPKDLKRDKFVIELRKKGVFATRIWREPVILNKEVQKEYTIDPSQFPITLEVAKRIVNFPLQNFYNKKDIEKIIEKVKETLRK